MSTETTNKKIKIDNGTTFGRTYTDKAVDELLKNIGGGGGGSSVLRKDATYDSKEGEEIIVNIISLSSEEYNRIKNGEISIIYGEFQNETGFISYYCVEIYSIMSNTYIYTNTYDIYNLYEQGKANTFFYKLEITEEYALLYGKTITQPSIPTLPTDASSKTYTLKAVNGVLTWVE